MWLVTALVFAGTIEDAIHQRQSGNLAGATALLDAYTPEPEDTAFYLYERAINAELAGDTTLAERLYREVMELGGDIALDAQFRLALVLEDQGHPDLALAEILSLARAKGLAEDDDATVGLQRGIGEVATGRVRRGVRRLQGILDELEGRTTHRYMRAKARVTLAAVLCDEADAYTMRGGTPRQVRHLKRRVADLQAAEDQVAAAARLNEPEWVLAGLLRLGDSYSRFSWDLARVPAPPRLTDAEEEIYRAELAKKAGVLRARADHIWRSGVELATRLQWESPRVSELKLRLGRSS